MKPQLDMLRVAAARGLLEIDVIALPFITEIDAIFAGRPVVAEQDYSGRLRVGGVKIVRLIGEGGMGRVYEAQQARPSRKVAVKVRDALLPIGPESRNGSQACRELITCSSSSL